MPTNKKAKGRFVELVHKFRDSFKPLSPDNVDEMNQGPFSIFTKRGVTVTVFGAAYEAFVKLGTMLGSLRFASEHSDDQLEDRLKDLLAAVLLDPSQTDELTSDLLTELDLPPPSFRALIPFFGIQLRLRELRIGRVILKTYTQDMHEALIKSLSDIVKKTLNPDAEKDAYQNFQTQRLAQLLNVTMAEIEVQGDTELSLTRAEFECRMVRDFLQLAAALFERSDFKSP